MPAAVQLGVVVVLLPLPFLEQQLQPLRMLLLLLLLLVLD
jgi:hypothetical protein